MQNRVEIKIQEGATRTFKVAPTKTVKIGELVELTGNDFEVQTVATAGSGKVIGVVYSGTVGIDGVNVGYKGDNGDVVTVVVLKPIVYLIAGAAINPGDTLKSDNTGKAVKIDTATDKFDAFIGRALSKATAAGQKVAVALG